MNKDKTDIVGNLLIIALLIVLTYAGILAHQSIDFKILERLEATPIPQTLQSH